MIRKRICLLGFGKSNRSFYKVMKSLEPSISFFISERKNIPENLKDELKENGDLWEEEHSDEILSCDLIIRSPGVNPNISILQKARKIGIPIETEVEYTYNLLKRTKMPILIGVTGTNGKTTTVEMIKSILERSGYSVFIGANMGIPFCEILMSNVKYDFAVLELSSFQLVDVKSLKLKVAVITNITEDHLDWHENFEGYIRAKLNILRNQGKEDTAVLNWDTVYLRNTEINGKLITFSIDDKKSTIYIADNSLIVKGKSFNIPKNIRGKHNLYNLMACIGATLDFVDPEESLSYLEAFKISQHRLEEFFTFDDTVFVNDSKSTNGSATVSAVNFYKSRRICLILQGRVKGENYERMVYEIKDHVSFVFTMGEISDVIIPILKTYDLNHKKVSSLDELMRNLKYRIHEFDVVLFSPAAASFDMFENYVDRGNKFKRKVLEWFGNEK